MDIIDNIRSAYENGDELTSEMIEELRLSFDIRDRLNNLFSLDVESSPKKMRDLLEKKGYTLDILKNLRFGLSSVAEGIDLKKINIFIASMENNIDEFYVSSAVYFNSMANTNTDLNMLDKSKLCVEKLVSKGYSKENVIKAINDYSATGQFDLGKSKGITVKLVRSKVKNPENVRNVPDSAASIVPADVPADLVEPFVFEKPVDLSVESSIPALPDSSKEFDDLESDLGLGSIGTGGGAKPSESDDLDALFSKFQQENPDIYGETSIEPTGSIKTDRFDNNQGLNPFDPNFPALEFSYGTDLQNESGQQNPFEVPYEGAFTKIAKIVKKVKRKLPKPDISKLKLKMLKALSKLMKVDLNNIDSVQNKMTFDSDSYSFIPLSDLEGERGLVDDDDERRLGK